ncbi:MAG: glycosidase [Spirochaetota bacterium]
MNRIQRESSNDIFERHPDNPIIWPGSPDWRSSVTFNPGVVRADDDRFLLYERTAGNLRPFHCYIGMLESGDGVNFAQVGADPVFTPEMAGSKHGSVQDPRVVQIEGEFLMTYAFRPFAWNSSPTGVSVPESWEAEYPEFDGDSAKNMTRTGLARSADGKTGRQDRWLTPSDLDDRDVILFPEKISGRYYMLRRPKQWVGPEYGTEGASIWITSSPDLDEWDDATLLAKAQSPWEGGRIGGSTPPVRTEAGWLTLYHGVEYVREIPWVRSGTGPTSNYVCYRVGAMLLDLDDPRKVIGRTRDFLMEPREYYEKHGLYIPNVVFPTGNVVVGDDLWIYYGVCDTAIALASAPIQRILDALE